MEPQFKVRSDPYTYDVAADLFKKYSSSCGNVLDIGCGSGLFLYKIKDESRNRFGCDFNTDQYQEEGNKNNIKEVNLDSEMLPYESNFFDVVTLLDVAEHLFNPYKIFEEALRVCKNGKYIIVSTPNVSNFIQRIFFLLTGEMKGFWYPEHSRELGERHITPIFKKEVLEFISGKADIVEEKFNRTIIPWIRIEIPIKNLFLSETVIWVIKKK